MASKPKVHPTSSTKIVITPRTAKQAEYLDLINSNYITFCIGPAGCGKTFLPCLQAMKDLQEGSVRKIILVRPSVTAGEDIGYLPGTLEEKMDPFMAPLYDAFNEYWQPQLIEDFLADGTIEIVPLAFMRGRTFRNAFIIADEAQNTTQDQMKMLLTRFGDDCRMVICGDVSQNDLKHFQVSGLRAGLKLAKWGVTGVASFEFDVEDVVRHPVVRDILMGWDELGLDE